MARRPRDYSCGSQLTLILVNVADRIARAAGEGPERRRIEAGGESGIIGGGNGS